MPAHTSVVPPIPDFLGPYRLIRQLGSGGMGEVFLADDPRLHRQVALKRPSATWLASPEAAERLHREARAAAQLNHPNIAGVYDVLDVEGRPYIVMEFVEGESLDIHLRQGPMPPARVVEVGLQITDALVEAHQHGITHRDMKPANIMLTPAGRVKVLDFGVAKLRLPVAGPQESATEAGRVFGTPGYIAPEQLLGGESNARSDIYSAGVVLFELLTGHRPYPDLDPAGRSLAVLEHADAPRADANGHHVPAPLADIVARAMARDPSRRFQTAAELRAALRRVQTGFEDRPTGMSGIDGPVVRPARRPWLWAAGLVLAVGAAVALWIGGPSGPRVAIGDIRPVVAVLPFENISGDPGNDHLSVGFADSLISDLSRIPGLAVVGRDVTRLFRGSTRDPKIVSRNLGSDLLITGSIQKNANRIRINWELLRADGSRVSSDSYESSDDQVFDLQRRLADGVAAAANVGAVGDPPPQTSDVVALNDYWRGRALLEKRDVSGNVEAAVQAFSKALERDTAFVAARAALGTAAAERYRETKDPAWMATALDASQKAAAENPALPDTQVSLARVYMLTGRTLEAIEALRRLLAARPDHDEAMELLGDTLVSADRRNEGIPFLERAVAQRPRFPNHHTRLAVAYFRNGEYQKAIAQLSVVTGLQPDNARGFEMLGASYQAIGDKPRAVEHYTAALKIAPSPVAYVNLGALLFSEKRYKEAAASFEQAVKLRPNEAINHRSLGDAYRRLGLKPQSVAAYQRAVDLSRAQLKVNSTDAGMIAQLAVCLAKLGQFGEAEREIGRAVKFSPTDSTVRFREAVVFSEAGKRREALAGLEAALASGYGAARVADDEDLAPIRDTAEFKALLQKYASPRTGGSHEA